MIIWNSCKDVMPDTVGEYLISYDYLGRQYLDIAYIEDDVFVIDDKEEQPENVTHWSELNKPLGVVTCTNNIHWEM